jgi:hypothetical protein
MALQKRLIMSHQAVVVQGFGQFAHIDTGAAAGAVAAIGGELGQLTDQSLSFGHSAILIQVQ